MGIVAASCVGCLFIIIIISDIPTIVVGIKIGIGNCCPSPAATEEVGQCGEATAQTNNNAENEDPHNHNSDQEDEMSIESIDWMLYRESCVHIRVMSD